MSVQKRDTSVNTLRQAAEREGTPVSRTELAVALATAARQWSPYEQVQHPYPHRSPHVQCRTCRRKGRTATDVNHREDCRYRLVKRILDNAREENLV